MEFNQLWANACVTDFERCGNTRRPLTLCVLEVMPPERPDLVLTADIPHCKTDVFEFYCLNIKTCMKVKNRDIQNLRMSFSLGLNSWTCRTRLTDGGDCGNNFSQFELVQDGSLSSSIQSYHQDPHLFLAKQPFKQATDIPHLGSPADRKGYQFSGYVSKVWCHTGT